MKNKFNSRYGILIILIVFFILISSLQVQARKGVGIIWHAEAALVNEKEQYCLTYGIYNPWDEDVVAIPSISDNFKDIVIEQEVDKTLIKAETMHEAAIPVKYCFKTPKVYEEDCLLFNSLICKKECNEEQKNYKGSIIIKEDTTTDLQSGGSATAFAVAAPLELIIRCNAHSRDYSLVYLTVSMIFLVIIIVHLYNKFRKPKIDRYKEKLLKLQKKIDRTKGR
ncbi:MAG: hypothetical protein KJ623_01920 [Nanoarchaeota archaeon]|nr:hypothetical protein [Nanoarchaeota archaeon]MBU0963001.1 hypothetical protein [Nanoarchaeota archaeon]